MAELTKMERLRHFVNAAHNYAAVEYKCTVTILQEYKEDNYVVVAMYDSECDPETDDPTCMATLSVTSAEVPFNCNFVLNRDPGQHALLKQPADLFRLMYA
ncbi:MAG: hypothetical protein ACWGQW_03240 [bacterium]